MALRALVFVNTGGKSDASCENHKEEGERSHKTMLYDEYEGCCSEVYFFMVLDQ